MTIEELNELIIYTNKEFKEYCYGKICDNNHCMLSKIKNDNFSANCAIIYAAFRLDTIDKIHEYDHKMYDYCREDLPCDRCGIKKYKDTYLRNNKEYVNCNIVYCIMYECNMLSLLEE